MLSDLFSQKNIITASRSDLLFANYKAIKNFSIYIEFKDIFKNKIIRKILKIDITKKLVTNICVSINSKVFRFLKPLSEYKRKRLKRGIIIASRVI